jgi:hypothetical protein
MRRFLAFALLVLPDCGGRAERAPSACDCAFDGGAPTPPPPLAPGPQPGAGQDAGPIAPTGPSALLFSGDGPAFLDDAWAFDGTRWWRLATAGSPPSRVRHAMAGRGGKIVLFGGAHLSSQMLGDTWEWDGAVGWSELSPAGPTPSPRADHAMAALGDSLVLYGGEDSGGNPSVGTETWTWDGAGWTQNATGPAPNPGLRIGHAMASLGGKVILYDGAAWTKKTIPGPGERAFFAMTTLGDKIVLFGGEKDANHYLSDTWEYDGTAWTPRDVPGPSARFHHGMTTVAGRVVLFGGESQVGTLPPWPADTWTWDAASWTSSTATGPGGRDVYTLAAQ